MFNKIFKFLFLIFLTVFIIILAINFFIIFNTRNKIITLEEAKQLKTIDCILILGAGIRDNSPSPMLKDRLDQGMILYDKKISPKILVSGDHMYHNHDEVNIMKDYLIAKNIPSQDIFMDHAGISTYDSLYRAKEIFQTKKIIIVTQKYHLYRSLYIAEQLGIESYGVSASTRSYVNQEIREIREILARTKDFFKALLKPPATFLGEPIQITGDGNMTNDKPKSNQ